MPRVWAADDPAYFITALQLLLRDVGFKTDVAEPVQEGRRRLDGVSMATRENQAAQTSQRSLLPSSLPQLEGCRIAARWQPAFDLGGDCYDAIPLGASSAAISIADVCGKGLPAALVMSHLQASVRAFAAADSAPASVASNVNGALCRNDGLTHFVTFFYATYDAATRRLAYTNAGHHPPIVVHADGSIERLTAGGMVLGVFENVVFEEGLVHLQPGDRIVLFTDGITEATDVAGQEFGDEQLAAAIVSRRQAPIGDLVDDIFSEVSQFTSGHMTDDATVVGLAID